MPRRTEAEALEDVSARMLQGWTMLGDACPVAGCNTPLVRSRQGEVWCARCGAAVVKEGDAMSVPRTSIDDGGRPKGARRVGRGRRGA